MTSSVRWPNWSVADSQGNAIGLAGPPAGAPRPPPTYRRSASGIAIGVTKGVIGVERAVVQGLSRVSTHTNTLPKKPFSLLPELKRDFFPDHGIRQSTNVRRTELIC
jgi:hypothetical protein